MNWPDDFINKIICGDCLEVMKEMPDECIDMAITSPPYWGLRDYGVEQVFGGDEDCKHEWGADLIQKQRGVAAGKTAQVGNQKKKIQGTHINQGNYCQKCQAWRGQLGLEPTPEMYIEHLTEIFNEVKRILKKEGTFWLNISDTYSGSGGAGGDYNIGGLREGQPRFKQGETKLQPKCLLMIPERLSWSLIQNGWILRNKNIWHKPNAMPSPFKDRFSNTYEFVYMFSKNNKPIYWTNKKTLKLVLKKPPGINGKQGEDWEWRDIAGEIKKYSFWTSHDYYFDLDGVREAYIEPLNRWGGPKIDIPKKTKWKSDDEKAKWAMSVRIRQSRPNPAGKNPGDLFNVNTQSFLGAHFAVFPERLCEKPIKAGCPEGGIVLDPFSGVGTALFVAQHLKRRFIGTDIKKEYCELAKKRLAQGVL